MITSLALIALLFQSSTARSVELWTEHPIVVTVEWLTIDAEGKAVVHDRRDVRVDTRASITYTSGDGRFVRLSYAGAAPHTYAASELGLYKSMRVPDVLPGGELLLIVPTATVRPAAIELDGPRVRTIQLTSAMSVSLAGVPAGTYRATPVYDGGMRGDPRTFAVTETASTVALMPAEEVGAARVLGEPVACTPASTVTVHRLFTPNVAPHIKTPPNRGLAFSSTAPRCDFVLGGLAPGQYEVAYASPRAVTGKAVFEIGSQHITPVTVGETNIVVSGHVSLNARPMTGVAVEFLFLGNDDSPGGGRSETSTDGAGYYRLALASPGRYQVLIRPAGVALQGMHRTDVREGAQTFDLALTGGSVTAEIAGWDRRADLQIEIEGGGSMAHSLLPRNGTTATKMFSALPFGTYTVSVRGYPEATRVVTVNAAKPEVTVTFVLSQR